ncbi:serine/threonine-protein kinase mos-like [Actinia tenebrosa]|uniref:non-specific serine/threonine protein kinase n=1 Tax=Actinia tenebrosa TaxID=6105 RepID=A0A6P8GZV9_ACTTE|nr:serine/threonine-protein kinase mos-like [Actinia tenebrosa]
MPNGKLFLEKCNSSRILCETKKLDAKPFVQEIEMLSEEERSLVRIGKVLGSGGFGCVYEGHYRGKQVAIKKFHVNSKSRRAMLQSFEAETSIMSFCHPNIIRTLGAFGKELQLGCRIIVMEFAGNKTLRNIIVNDKDAINEERRLKFGFQIGSALEFLHNREIAHLDVKPANILVDKHDVCKLGDFGCSQIIGEGDDDLPASPTCSYLTGTFAYRAPELLKGEAPTTQADMYSMGICLWQLLTREQPYGSENLYVVVFGVVAYNLRPPVPQADNQCLQEYDALVERLWQADPTLRPNATETMEILRMLQL